MQKLLDEEYFLFGTDKILKEEWMDIQTYQINNYLKPIGGLWLSHQNKHYLSDWIEYKENKHDSIYKQMVNTHSSALVKFKNNIKFLCIKTENDFKNLKESGFTIVLKEPIKYFNGYNFKDIYELPNYEKISEYFDLLYVDEYADISLRSYSIRTMLVLNLKSIDYYKPLKVDYNKFEILDIGEKKEINNPDLYYYKLIEYVRALFENDNNINTFINHKEYITYLNKLKNDIIKIINKKYEKLIIPEYINKTNMFNAIINNVYKEKTLKLENK